MSKRASLCAAFYRVAFIPLFISSSLAFAELSFVEVPVTLDSRIGSGSLKGVDVSNNGVVAVANIGQTFTWSLASGVRFLGEGAKAPYSIYISNDGAVVATAMEGAGGPEGLFRNGYALPLPKEGLQIRNLSADGSRLAVSVDGTAGTYDIHEDFLALYDGTQVLGYSADNTKTLVQMSAGPLSTSESILHSSGSEKSIDATGRLRLLPWHPGVTGDGLSVVGEFANCPSGAEGCFARLDLETDLVSEIDTDGVDFRPRSASFDGSVVLADGKGASGEYDGLMWDDVNGLRSFKKMLLSKGLDVAGWSGFRNLEISLDGTNIAGTAISPDGLHRAFLVTDIPVCLSGFK